MKLFLATTFACNHTKYELCQLLLKLEAGISSFIKAKYLNALYIWHETPASCHFFHYLGECNQKNFCH